MSFASDNWRLSDERNCRFVRSGYNRKIALSDGRLGLGLANFGDLGGRLRPASALAQAARLGESRPLDCVSGAHHRVVGTQAKRLSIALWWVLSGKR